MTVSYQRTFKNLDGVEVSYTYRVLTRRDALEIEYNALGSLSEALSGAAPAFLGLLAESDGSPLGVVAPIAQAIASIHKAVPFETLWRVASKVLEGAVILGPQGSAKIDRLDDSDYFNDKLDELVLATFWGLDVSFPRLFSKARNLLNRFVAPVAIPGETTSKGSNGASTETS